MHIDLFLAILVDEQVLLVGNPEPCPVANGIYLLVFYSVYVGFMQVVLADAALRMYIYAAFPIAAYVFYDISTQ